MSKISISRIGLIGEDYIYLKIVHEDMVINTQISMSDFARVLTGVSGTECTCDVRYKSVERNRVNEQI